jgi:sugar phosphate isomerase/epimerase
VSFYQRREPYGINTTNQEPGTRNQDLETMNRKPESAITRRRFMQGMLAAPMILSCGGRDPMQRIGMTSVTFRMRFPATRPPQHPDFGSDLTLMDIPQYFADRFRLHNVELWSEHFADRSSAYLSDLRKQVERAGSKVINIQVDGPYDLSDTDEQARSRSVDFIRQWIDTAVGVGSPAIRANSGKIGTFEQCVKSFRELAEYGRQTGVIVLVENHFGVTDVNPPDHVRLMQIVDSPYLRTLPDFGNYAPEVRYEGLKAIMPWAYLISAKAEGFNDQWEHTRFDFDQCMRIAEDGGFTGIYSAEYWDQTGNQENPEKVADWIIEHIAAHL